MAGRVTLQFSDPMRPVDRPLAWLGQDRLLLDDCINGMRRRVLAAKGDCPDMVSHLHQAYNAAGDADVDYWMAWRNGYCFLWIVWKEA